MNSNGPVPRDDLNPPPVDTTLLKEQKDMSELNGKIGDESISARHPTRPVNFYCSAPEARAVSLIGDFNHWNPLPMTRRGDGWWFLQVMLPHGHHRYQFLVDGRRVLDPQASGVARDEHDGEVSLIAVS
jgi:1,4-alpha-glucan branching enzyme